MRRAVIVVALVLVFTAAKGCATANGDAFDRAMSIEWCDEHADLDELDELVVRWCPMVFAEFGPEWTPWALRIVACESRGDPAVKNRKSSATGLFQFIRSTWDWVAGKIGLPDHRSGAPRVAEWNIEAAAWLLEHGGRSHWKCKARK